MNFPSAHRHRTILSISESKDRPGRGHLRPLVARLAALGVAMVTVVTLGPAATLAANGDWTQFRESQTHQAHNTSELILSDSNVHALGLAWTGATGAAVDSSPAVANGVVYVGSADGKLYAFAVGCATGGGTCAPLWTATTGGPIHSSPTVDTGVVYVGSDDGKVYAFDAAGATGCGGTPDVCTPLWTATTGAAVQSSAAVAFGVVYVGSNDGKLYAFASGCASGGASCNPLWTATTGGPVHSSPSILSGVIYVGSADGKLYAFDAAGATGCSGTPNVCTPLWTAATGGPIYSSPSVGDSRVWVGSDDGKVYAFRTSCSTGGGACTPLWTGDTGHPVRSSPASANGVVYVGSSDGKLYAFRADCAIDGSACVPAWSRAIGTSVQSSPTVSSSVVYAGSSDGKLYAFHLVADHLALVPAAASIVAGATQAYTAEGFDSANADLGDLTSLTTFTINGAGTCAGNLCGSAVGGDYTVTGTFGTATGSTSLHVARTGSTFFPLSPTRLLDTRSGTGLSGTFTSHVARTFAVAGRGGVPASATAVTGNLTVTGQTARGYLFVGPTPINNPTSSTLNFPLGDDRANAVTVALGSDGSLGVTYVSSNLSAKTHVVFDVTGYFLPDLSGATFFAVAPARLLDTRSGNGLSGVFTSQVARTFAVAGRGGVPANATAVTGNLTVTGQSARGYLFVGPTPINKPTSSTVNFPLGDDRANAVTVALGTGNLSVTYFSSNLSAHANVVFDVTGYFVSGTSGATFVALAPTRLLDTRVANGLTGVFIPHVARTFAVSGRGGVPTGAAAVTGNLTVTGQTARGYLFMGPTPVNNPTSSTLNFPLADDRANAATVALAPDGSLGVTYVASNLSAQTQVVFDATGFFLP